MTLRQLAPGLAIQGCTPPLPLENFGLIAFGMDSMMVTIDCIDELADAVGLREEMAALAVAALRGGVAGHRENLRRRVALLRGATIADMELICTGQLRIEPGAERLVRACQAAGLKTLLVSSGFTAFTDPIRDRLGIDFTRASVLEIESGPNCGQLTGRLVDQPWGDICDADEKRRMLLETCEQLGIGPRQAIVVGGGTDDLPMMGEAGLSVAWRARPQVHAQAMVQIEEGGLDRLLEVFA